MKFSSNNTNKGKSFKPKNDFKKGTALITKLQTNLRKTPKNISHWSLDSNIIKLADANKILGFATGKIQFDNAGGSDTGTLFIEIQSVALDTKKPVIFWAGASQLQAITKAEYTARKYPFFWVNVKDVLTSLKESFDPKKHIIISVVTGVYLKELQEVVDKGVPLFRAMPNTAIAIQESVTCLCHQDASETHVNYVKKLFDQLGITIPIEEKLMDAATVLGACGIAYALRFIRAATQGGIEIGFDAKTASLIAAQTVKGSAELLLKLNRHPEEEIDKVTTPKGCTIVGLNEMEHNGFSSSLIRGISASYNKIVS